MNQEDFNLFSAASLVIRMKEQVIIRFENSINNLESVLAKYSGQKVSPAMKPQLEKLKKNVLDLKEQREKVEKELPKYLKVFNELNEKYFDK